MISTTLATDIGAFPASSTGSPIHRQYAPSRCRMQFDRAAGFGFHLEFSGGSGRSGPVEAPVACMQTRWSRPIGTTRGFRTSSLIPGCGILRREGARETAIPLNIQLPSGADGGNQPGSGPRVATNCAIRGSNCLAEPSLRDDPIGHRPCEMLQPGGRLPAWAGSGSNSIEDGSGCGAPTVSRMS